MEEDRSLIGWHGTRNDFDDFDESYFGSTVGNSPNGALGVWIYTRPDLAGRHGETVFEIEAVPRKTLDLRAKRMMEDHEEASGSDDPRAWFAAQRASLRAEGYDAIRMVEKDGSSAISIILDLSVIRSATKLVSPAPMVGFAP